MARWSLALYVEPIIGVDKMKIWLVSWVSDDEIYSKAFHKYDDAIHCYNLLVYYDFREITEIDVE
jgi:hypothetical protein